MPGLVHNIAELSREDRWNVPHIHIADTVSARILDGYAERVRECGGDAAKLLACVDIPTRVLSGGERQLPFARYAMLLEITATALDCPNFGMHLAAGQRGIELLGPIERLLTTAPTVGDVLNDTIAYMHFFTTGIQLSLERPAKCGLPYMRFEVVAKGAPYRRQAIEQAIALSCQELIRLTDGAAHPREIWFSHRALGGKSEYARHFRSAVRFSQPFNAVFYGEDDFEKRIAGGSRAEHDLEKCRLSGRYPQKRPIGVVVSEAINRRISDLHCTREAISADLGIHSRTLHRRLQEEGLTFEELIDKVRRDLVLHSLVQSDLPLIEIAISAGYSALPSLSRACTRWFGMSPLRLRRKLEAQAAAIAGPRR